MKYIFSWVAFLAVLFIILPIGISGIFFNGDEAITNGDLPRKICLLNTKTGKKENMEFEKYILGVVMAEMPATFDSEALKAQSVAARTYALAKMKSESGIMAHRGADVCDDFAHCQAYITEKKAKSNWNKNASEYLKKCKNAVDDTEGEIMIYDGEPIKAVFHSSSSGKTENARDVWGGSVDYLVSVESPGERECPSHESEVSVGIEDFKEKVKKEYKADFSKEIIGEAEYNDSGSVKSLSVGTVRIKGTEIRKMFDLRSTSFKAEVVGDKVIFRVVGNGHGVGMSQYGANYLAKSGYDYKQILKRYYSGVEIEKISSKNE